MADWAKLIEAIAGLLGTVAWPTAVAIMVWLVLRRQHGAVTRFIDRLEEILLPGGAGLRLKAVVQETRDEVQELVEQVTTESDPRRRQQAAQELAERAEQLGMLGIIRRGNALTAEPDIRTEGQWRLFVEWVEAEREKRRRAKPGEAD
ncbi:hypothetical protein ABZ897_00770 [Nonomuraea sp. NPDC046802]|uniref:hypothetical protein n=1 Tax=Nonomuraea sp. NPDC046802 TaxID=3154919 RepID=UPI0033C9B4D6